MGQRVVVTGGAGFIGANLCAHLASQDWVDHVVALDNLATGFESNLDGVDAELIVGSILDDADLDKALSGADAVVHLAARPSVPRSIDDPMASHEANATGTLMVLEAARRHGEAHTIVAGSSSVYGSNPILPKHEELATRPMSPYGVTKLATEAYAIAWGTSYGMPTLAFRFFNVFGPLQPAGHVYAAVIPAFADAALRGQAVTVHGDGLQSRDFTFVGTVTSTIVRAVLERTTCDTPVNLAFGSRISLLDTLALMEEILGHPIERDHIERRAGDVPHSQADNSLLMSLFPGLEPVPFDDGLRSTLDWMRTTVVGAS